MTTAQSDRVNKYDNKILYLLSDRNIVLHTQGDTRPGELSYINGENTLFITNKNSLVVLKLLMKPQDMCY